MISETKASDGLGLPWESDGPEIRDSEGDRFAEVFGSNAEYERAAYIARAVNSHEALVAMVERLTQACNNLAEYHAAKDLLASLEKPDV